MPASLFIKSLLFSGKTHLSEGLFFFFLPSPNLAFGRRQSEYLGNKEIEMGHQDAVSPQSPVDHHDILTIGEKLVLHVLTGFFFCMAGYYDYCHWSSTTILGCAEEERGLTGQEGLLDPIS
jgi:hypothetical protein